MQRLEVVWDRDVNFKCGLTEIVKFCARNLGDGVSGQVKCHWQLQIFLNSPRRSDNLYSCFSTTILYTPKDSCLLQLSRLLPAFFF